MEYHADTPSYSQLVLGLNSYNKKMLLYRNQLSCERVKHIPTISVLYRTFQPYY